MITKIRRKYIAPSLDVLIVELENSIASMSAQVFIETSNRAIAHELESNMFGEGGLFW